jgi:tetratricopeptide (TPR) repeat protein
MMLLWFSHVRVHVLLQIHLQYGQSDDAMKMLTETLERGNRALAAIYRQIETEQSELLATTKTVTTSGTATTTTTTNRPTPEDDHDSHIDGDNGGDDEYDYERLEEISDDLEQRDMFRTVRLRRKLARTLINIAHVHYFNCNYDAAMASLKGAIPLVDAKVMTGRTLAAIWYNMSLVFYNKGGVEQGMLQEALVHLDKFLELATKLNGPDHLQNSNALYRKARVLVEMGNTNAAMEPIEESLRIRKLKLDENHGRISEALGLKGKILLSRNECDAALDALNTCFEMQCKQQQQQQLKSGGDAGGDDQHLTFEMAQTLLDIGQALHIQGHVDASIEKYLEVLEWLRKFFGPKHAFVARVDGIIGNIYVEAGKMQEAKPFLDEAAAIQQEMPQKTS